MKSMPVVVAAALMCGSVIRAEAEPLKPESLKAYQSRVAWFAGAQYGIFIHFDLYSIPNEKCGNLLLSVGPDGRGVVQPEAIAILRETAELLKANPIQKNIPEINETPGAR